MLMTMESKRERWERAGEWLRSTRERQGFETAADLARELKVNPSAISRYERGVSSVPLDRARDIADLFGMRRIDVFRALELIRAEEIEQNAAVGQSDEEDERLLQQQVEIAMDALQKIAELEQGKPGRLRHDRDTGS